MPFNYRLECPLDGTWTQFGGGWNLEHLREDVDVIYERDGEPVRIVDNATGQVVYELPAPD